MENKRPHYVRAGVQAGEESGDGTWTATRFFLNLVLGWAAAHCRPPGPYRVFPVRRGIHTGFTKRLESSMRPGREDKDVSLLVPPRSTTPLDPVPYLQPW